jgi:hypothetical protein
MEQYEETAARSRDNCLHVHGSSESGLHFALHFARLESLAFRVFAKEDMNKSPPLKRGQSALGVGDKVATDVAPYITRGWLHKAGEHNKV